MTKALIVVDVQQDFCEGGSLAVDGGKAIAQKIYNLIRDDNDYDHMIATKDYHINPGHHFSDTPDFIDSWPRHCVVGTPGAEFTYPLSDELFGDNILYKGRWSAAYSGFEAVQPGLAGLRMQLLLNKLGVDEVDIVGLALDYCVKATALDAVVQGLDTTILVDYTASVHPENEEQLLNELNEAGVNTIS